MEEKVGHWAFLFAVLLGIIAGVLPTLQNQPWLMWTLAMLGVVIGLLNITIKEITQFLVAGVALVVSGTVLAPMLPEMVKQILTNIIAVVAPATILVSMKTMWELAKE